MSHELGGAARFLSGLVCACLAVWISPRGYCEPKIAEALAGKETRPPRVLILANSNMPESVRLAEYYAEARGLSKGWLVTLPLSSEETISWREFVATLWQPLQELCIRRGWIEAIPMEPVDMAGRRKHVVYRHEIDYLVICRGVPLRIAHDPALVDARELRANGNRHEFATNQASVDNELALLGVGANPIMGFVPNPLFGANGVCSKEGPRVVKAMRLDGCSWADARSLVDQALAGERFGLIGQAYVDIGGPYPPGDSWFEAVVTELSNIGFPTVVDRRPTLMDQTARFDAPVLYFGWHASEMNGAFKLPGLRLAPGSLAYHLHSYSAYTLRDPGKGWAGPLVGAGAAGTLGNVYEPYLALTQNPLLWLRHLVRGGCLGDAGYHAMPALSWQTTLLGDPLYRPFSVPFERQWMNRDSLPAGMRPYLVMRKMLLLELEQKPKEALALGLAEFENQPNLQMALAVASRLRRVQRNGEAGKCLAVASEPRLLRSDEWGLLHEIALELEALDDAKRAYGAMVNLFEQKGVPKALRRAWLPDGIRLARRCGETKQGLDWERELADLLQ